jgi:SAM-dependent methyltransferase
MTLRSAVPPRFDQLLARNAYARTGDFDSQEYADTIRALEGFQAAFLATTRDLWDRAFPIPGDVLAHFSRQWELPYVWANLGRAAHRVLDAGSGLTFLPYLLAAAGATVTCCDHEGGLELEERHGQAAALTRLPVTFGSADLANLPYANASFDAVTCVSVMEHVGTGRRAILGELARVLAPGGRLVLTCDVDLRGVGHLDVAELAVMLKELEPHFAHAHPLDLRRPPDLLTSEHALATTPWRLPWPWRPPIGEPSRQDTSWRDHFRSIAILGLCLVRRA